MAHSNVKCKCLQTANVVNARRTYQPCRSSHKNGAPEWDTQAIAPAHSGQEINLFSKYLSILIYLKFNILHYLYFLGLQRYTAGCIMIHTYVANNIVANNIVAHNIAYLAYCAAVRQLCGGHLSSELAD